jgi:hypothetical protein
VIDGGDGWRIVQETNTGLRGFLHMRCGSISWNPNDVEHRYCGACHRFAPDVIRL